jgi:Nitrile hydratase, alpha chain
MREQVANWDYQWSQVVGQAWADDAFKQRLFADPAAALKDYGLDMPAGVRVLVLENPDTMPQNTDEVLHFVLPPKPSAEDLSEEELHGGTVGPGLDRCGCGHCGCQHCHYCARCACDLCD